MAEANLPMQAGADIQLEKKAKAGSSTLSRVAKYTGVRVVTLVATVIVSLYLTIMIANMGGYVDLIRKGAIRETVSQRVIADPAIKNLPPDARTQRLNQMIQLEEHRLGLDQPFTVRSFAFLVDALTLNLGRAQNMSSDSGSRQVRLILLERLPATLLLFGAANMIDFFLSVFLALYLSRRYGSLFDKITIALSPLSSAPAWFYGLFLILIFAALLGVLPFGGLVDAPPPDTPVAYIVNLLKHMILPVLAWTISTIFAAIYGWRTFFLIYSSEDYVDMAKAKGLSSRDIERRYILRPTLPNILTTFALTLITLWTGAPILEGVFNWPGLGRTLLQAIGLYDTAVIVGSTVIFAYLLAITVFLLDFIYALVDPRVKIGGEGARA
jgi:peptide/nickel transport system permease protein